MYEPDNLSNILGRIFQGDSITRTKYTGMPRKVPQKAIIWGTALCSSGITTRNPMAKTINEGRSSHT